MIRLVLQKMLHNSWMVLCLAAGSLLAVALISSIPMYTDGIMQRMLVRDLENFQRERSMYPGNISARFNFYNPNIDRDRVEFYGYINQNTEEELIPSLGLPVLESSRHAVLDYWLSVDTERPEEENQRPNTQVQALEGIGEHVNILHGRMYEPGIVDGAYEVIVTQQGMINLDLTLGHTYEVFNMMNDEPAFNVRVVGIFEPESNQDLFWFRRLRELADSYIMDFDTFEREFISEYIPNLTYVYWFFALDYEEITVDRLPGLLSTIRRYERLTHQYRIDFNFRVLPIFEEYNERANVLSLMLLFLQTPVLLMLVFFIYMVSQLVVSNERNEIAVLKSRGAGINQVFNVYLVESIILGAAALVIGPLTGFLICSILGSANGFMEFVQRVALPVRLNPRTYFYAAGGFLLFVVTMLLPVLAYSRSTIVEYKRRNVRRVRKVFWKRFYIDVMLIALSGYGLYSYNAQQEILAITGVKGSALPVDPLLFSISVLFILGTGLLVLRLFPYFVNLLFSLGRRIWKPHIYAAFIQVARSGGVQQFLMIFLILSLSIGVFNSTAARTINRNVEDKIRYEIGADIAVTPHWQDLSATDSSLEDPEADLIGAGAGGQTVSGGDAPQYVEPPFDIYRNLDGVETATKVYRNDRVSLRMPGGRNTTAELMGVVPHEFAKVAWFRRDLLPYHWYNYLDLLATSPKAMLVSRSLAEEYDLKQGDSILVSWAGQGTVEGLVYAFVDYWPSINPRGSGAAHHFLIANLTLLHAKMAMEPYDTWIKKEPGATSRQIFEAIEEADIDITRIEDADQEIIKQKNDPMLQGANGVLTLGFLVSMAISIAGFIIYWVLSLRHRELQFGIIRAMGMDKGRVSAMLVWEHLLITGIAIILGITIGRISANLFVPLIQIVYASAEQVPPFKIIVERTDFLQIYVIGAAMILIGIVLFRFIISRLNVHQALKLGEE